MQNMQNLQNMQSMPNIENIENMQNMQNTKNMQKVQNSKKKCKRCKICKIGKAKPNQIYKTKPINQNLPNLSNQTYQTKQNLAYWIYQTKPNWANQAYWTKPTKQNQNYCIKQSTPRSVKPLAMVFFLRMSQTFKIKFDIKSQIFICLFFFSIIQCRAWTELYWVIFKVLMCLAEHLDQISVIFGQYLVTVRPLWAD